MSSDIATSAHLPPPPEQMRDLLATHFDSTGEEQSARERALYDALCAYVRQLRESNVPPERMITTIKTIANRSGVPNSRHDDDGRPNRREHLMRMLVKWSIEAYYRAD